MKHKAFTLLFFILSILNQAGASFPQQETGEDEPKAWKSTSVPLKAYKSKPPLSEAALKRLRESSKVSLKSTRLPDISQVRASNITALRKGSNRSDQQATRALHKHKQKRTLSASKNTDFLFLSKAQSRDNRQTTTASPKPHKQGRTLNNSREKSLELFVHSRAFSRSGPQNNKRKFSQLNPDASVLSVKNFNDGKKMLKGSGKEVSVRHANRPKISKAAERSKKPKPASSPPLSDKKALVDPAISELSQLLSSCSRLDGSHIDNLKKEENARPTRRFTSPYFTFPEFDKSRELFYKQEQPQQRLQHILEPVQEAARNVQQVRKQLEEAEQEYVYTKQRALKQAEKDKQATQELFNMIKETEEQQAQEKRQYLKGKKLELESEKSEVSSIMHKDRKKKEKSLKRMEKQSYKISM